MTVFEIGDERIVVDAGMAFPRDEHLGVDLILPDFGYLHDVRIRAVVLTHAHEDHVGALPYLMREVRVEEIWATRLTLGLVKSKLDEHGLLRAAELREIEPEDGRSTSGRSGSSSSAWRTRSRRVGMAIETPAGRVFHTGDWKLDHTPVDGLKTDVGRLAELGNRGVDLLSATRRMPSAPASPARSASSARRSARSSRRARAACSSRASRRTSTGCSRRSTSRANGARSSSSAVDAPQHERRAQSRLRRCPRTSSSSRPTSTVPPNEQLIRCTGSQGEPLSALTRIAYNDHPRSRSSAATP